MRQSAGITAALCVGAILAVGACRSAGRSTPTPDAAAPASRAPAASRIPGGCSTPATERPGEIGCYLTASAPLGGVPAQPPVFWHLDAYPTRAAAEAARGAGGTVVESLGRVWLFTIAPAAWRPAGGERVARVGPLPVAPGRAYTARYMESVLPPGIPSVVHRHSGAEAWYVVAGAQCLETPDGTTTMRAGHGGVVPAGPPMMLVGIGTTVRRALVLVVHDPAQPWMTVTADWTPKGACSG